MPLAMPDQNAGFPLALEDVFFEVERPAFILASDAGELFLSEARGGIVQVEDSGHSRLILGEGRPADFLPNGIDLLADGSLLIANLGQDGGIWILAWDDRYLKHRICRPRSSHGLYRVLLRQQGFSFRGPGCWRAAAALVPEAARLVAQQTILNTIRKSCPDHF